jgi:hypothetical protein
MGVKLVNLDHAVRLAFIHVPKTAGTSFGRVIEENAGPAYRFRGLRRLRSDDLTNFSIIRGHMAHGVHRFVPGQVRYFTFLRSPVEQCISYYYFSRSWVGQPDYEDAMEHDLVGFYRLKRHQNMQTRFIGGYIPHALNFLVPDRILLSNAKRRLERDIAFGLVERYEESVRRLCRDFGWQKAPIVHVRQAKGRPDTAELLPEVLASLMESNRLDLALYEFARALFEKRG